MPLPKEKIEAILRDRPGLNVAIALHQTDFIDVECDSNDAEANFANMCDGEIPHTLAWRSKRGMHRLFRRPHGLPKKAVIKIDGVEFRIANGPAAISLVPPSETDGFRRYWVTDPGAVQIAELPDCVLKRLSEANSKRRGRIELSAFTEGERNNELFTIGCRLAGEGVTGDSLETALLEINGVRCQPPLSEIEVGGIAESASSRSSVRTQRTQKRPVNVVEIVGKRAELWHTPDQTAFASIEQCGHVEHWPIGSKQFKLWLRNLFYEQEQRSLNSQAMQDVLGALEARALFAGPTMECHLRVAEYGGRIYLDLVDSEWRAVEIDTNGWRIVERPPVRFRRGERALPLPDPVQGGSLHALKRFVNVSGASFPLVLGWLLDAYRPSGSHPILNIISRHDSGKTTATRILRALVDPNRCPTRALPKSPQDLMIAAEHGRVCAFDNLSYISAEMSDALCRLSTGGGYAGRTLYENSSETAFYATRPIILNGIVDTAVRPDLLDRCLVIELNPISNSERRSEKAINEEFEAEWPRILGALLDAVSAALRNLPAIEAREDLSWPRMVDFTQWVTAAEDALGMTQGSFRKAYNRNRASANETVVNESPIVAALKSMIGRSTSKTVMTATDLLMALRNTAEGRGRGFPTSPRALSAELNRLMPSLQEAGWTVDRCRKGDGKVWVLERPRPRKPGTTG